MLSHLRPLEMHSFMTAEVMSANLHRSVQVCDKKMLYMVTATIKDRDRNQALRAGINFPLGFTLNIRSKVKNLC